MHTCPDCYAACYCNGDFEDHDTGDRYTADCLHCDGPFNDDAGDDDPDLAA